MRTVQHVVRLREPVLRRFSRISNILKEERLRRPDPIKERAVAYAIVELLNTWSEFARALFLSYALGASDSQGVSVTHNIHNMHSVEDALFEASSFSNPSRRLSRPVRRRFEPTWHHRSTLTRLSTHFGFSNLSAINNGLSVQTRSFDDLPTIRNFYSHKNADTFKSAIGVARYYVVPQPMHPTELVLSVASGRSQSIGEDWVSDLQNVIVALT